MLDEQKKIADEVMIFLKKQEGRPTLFLEILHTIEKNNHSQDNIRYVVIMLKHKGFIEYTANKDSCFITDKGWLYENYDKVLADEKHQNDLAESQIESVIKTNKMQRWSFWASLITALAAIAVSLISLFKQQPNIINPSIVLQDTILNSTNKETLQLRIRVNQLGDTSKKVF